MGDGHADGMSCPQELVLHYCGGGAGHFCLLPNADVCASVLPLELQSSQVPAVGGPWFCPVQQGGENHSFVEQELGINPEILVFIDSFPESGISSIGTAQVMVDLKVRVRFGGEKTAEVGQWSTFSSRVLSTFMIGGVNE